MKKYYINYNTGAGNDTANTLKEAIETAVENAAYTQQPIIIENEDGIEVARLPWYGVKATDEDEVTVDFGDYGFYGTWEIVEEEEYEDASSVADWIELFLEENEQHSVETISLNTDLAKLEEILEGRGYRIEKNGSLWIIRKQSNRNKGLRKIYCFGKISSGESGALYNALTDEGAPVTVYTTTRNGETYAQWTAEEVDSIEDIENAEWEESPGIYFLKETSQGFIFQQAEIDGHKFAILLDDENMRATLCIWNKEWNIWDGEWNASAAGVDPTEVGTSFDFDAVSKMGYIICE